MPVPGWRDSYGALLRDVADAVADVPDLDLTVECITHRFTAASKDVLLGWYPRTKLDMDESARTRKFGKFGSAKYVFPKETMAELRSWFDAEVAGTLPAARMLYWT
jgi:spore photoproduct lyase